MKNAKFLTRALAVAGLFTATVALADDPIELTDFFYVVNTPVLDTLCIVAPPEAAGQPCTVYEVLRGGAQFQVAMFPLVPGNNFVVAPDLGATNYLATGPGIQSKYLNPGGN